jgi:tetratricopeptide (TPR) repeat protein
VARTDWFRNSSWDPQIEAAFRERLRRAKNKNKSQYLRIQASMLAKSVPEVALRLLDEYFLLGEHFDQAQAHVDRATAYLSLNNVDAAIASYEAALAREETFPNLKTRTYLDLPYLIAVQRLTHRYERAMELLERRRSDVLFHVDHYLWNGTRALILFEQGHKPEARVAAELALAAAAETKSGFRYHPDIGVVKNTQDEFGERVKAMAHGSSLMDRIRDLIQPRRREKPER